MRVLVFLIVLVGFLFLQLASWLHIPPSGSSASRATPPSVDSPAEAEEGEAFFIVTD